MACDSVMPHARVAYSVSRTLASRMMRLPRTLWNNMSRANWKRL